MKNQAGAKAEVQLLIQKVQELALKNPEKAAKILELWIQEIHQTKKVGNNPLTDSKTRKKGR